MSEELELANVVIPDSIDPVYGWKGMLLYGNTLVSPSMSTAWPKLQPFEAVCHGGYRGLNVWKPVRFGEVYEAARNSYSNGVFWMELEHPPRPNTELPEMMFWAETWEPIAHTPADAGCACGIYFATDISRALGYGPILVRMAGWGVTTEYEHGYRVQYAYPDTIYVDTLRERSLLQKYGVPVVLKKNAGFAISHADNLPSLNKLRWVWRILCVLTIFESLLFVITRSILIFTFALFLAALTLAVYLVIDANNKV